MNATAAAERDHDLPSIERNTSVTTPAEMLSRALENGASMEVMEKLMALHERWEANQARKAFDAALADAKGEIPVIFKNRQVDFTSAKGRTNYRHEDLAGIARTIDPILKRHGLSYRFRTEQDGSTVRVTCVVAHRGGHSEENSLAAGRDESGNKNSIQAVGSTITYLQRYTLKAALGLSASTDDDGATAEDQSGTISAEQEKELRELVEKAGGEVEKFCQWAKISELSDMLAVRFPTAKLRLLEKIAKASEAASDFPGDR